MTARVVRRKSSQHAVDNPCMVCHLKLSPKRAQASSALEHSHLSIQVLDFNK